MTADHWGIDDGYFDIGGQWHSTDAAVAERLRAAMGAHEHPDGPPGGPPIWFVRQGDDPLLHGPAEVTLEDGTPLACPERLPGDLPLGYHELRPLDGGPTTWLVVAPHRAHLPEGLRSWGWAVQTYALRSRRSWGIGDLADVATLGRIASAQGASFTTISPLHAPGPGLPQQPSPYFASSRRWRNPLLLRVEEVPGVETLRPADRLVFEALAAEGRASGHDPLIDRDRVWSLKLTALELLWGSTGAHARSGALARWRAEQGEAMEAFAVHQVLVEHHGGNWPTWPEQHRRPDSPAVARFAQEHAHRVTFHVWLQWLLDLQLERAGRTTGLVSDLAVGVAPDGADTWRWPDVYASGVRVGAPPDEFNSAGQDWGLPPYIPWALRAARYAPFIESLRAAFRHAAGVRIDHVMGLFRLYWIAAGCGPDEGAYVRYPSHELLDLVALESVRAGALVVGEDLGTVEEGVRDELEARGLLSTRLVWFESEPPSRFPVQSLGAITTHDLPTVAGLLDGSDAEERRAAGVSVDEAAEAEIRGRLLAAAATGGAVPDDQPTAVAAAVSRALADGPPMLVSATLEDALGSPCRPNLPGTTTERPNWSIPIPLLLEDLADDPGVMAVVRAHASRSAAAGRPHEQAPGSPRDAR